MDNRKKKDKPPRDFWDEIFGQSFNEFINMRRHMERIFRASMRTFDQKEMNTKPFVYGFSIRVGPDGIPHIQQFGNTKFGKKGFTGETDKSEREPLTDIIEAEDHIAITMELPGIEKEDINMELVENKLTIDVDTETRTYHKDVDLPDDLDFDSISATCKNGILDIVIKRKKTKPKKGKRIKID